MFVVFGCRLCLTYVAKAGGYLIARNIATRSTSSVEYSKVTETRTLCYRFDDQSPQHCAEHGHCSNEPLSLSSRITRSNTIIVSFKNWSDPLPAGGYSSQASSIESYTVTMSEVIPSEGQVERKAVFTKTVKSNINRLTIKINSTTPVLYRILLEVKDVADNVAFARRFLLYDNTSKIETSDKKSTFFVKSASPDTNFVWQTHHHEICLSWTDYFFNRFYLENDLFGPVKEEYGIKGVHEQSSGLLPVRGTPNVHGIVQFKISWQVNNGSHTKPVTVRNFQNQTFCRLFPNKDGDFYQFKVTPIDIVGNTYSDQRRVQIDKSNPVVNNIWLTAKGYHRLFFHNSKDLSLMQLTFEAFDPHSGLHTVHWTFGIRDTKTKLSDGYLAVSTLQNVMFFFCFSYFLF